MAEAPRNKPSILTMLVIMVVVVGGVFYGIIAINTSDPLWFRNEFDGQAVEIVVHCYGEDVVLGPQNASFAALNQALNDALSGNKRWDQISLSMVSYQEYQTSDENLVVEAYYAPPVRVHSDKLYFNDVDTLIFPLVGRHDQYNAVFARAKNEPTAGSYHLESNQVIRDVLAAEGLCATR